MELLGYRAILLLIVVRKTTSIKSEEAFNELHNFLTNTNKMFEIIKASMEKIIENQENCLSGIFNCSFHYIFKRIIQYSTLNFGQYTMG